MFFFLLFWQNFSKDSRLRLLLLKLEYQFKEVHLHCQLLNNTQQREKSNYLGHTLPPAGHLSASQVHTFFVLLPFMVLVYIKLKGVDDADANLRISGDIKPRDSSLLQGVLLVYHFLIHFRYNLLIHHSLFIFHTDFQSLNKKRNTHMLETHKAYGNWSPTDI